MRGLLIRWIVAAIALYVTSLFAQALCIGIIVTGAVSALLAVVILAVVNALIKPLIELMTLPLNCLTLGLFKFVINALMFWLVGSGIIKGFVVHGFLAALFGSIVLSVITGLADQWTSSKE